MTPPGVSHPGHFAAAPCGTTLAAYSTIGGFEMRFLYAHGSAQVGFSPFETKFDITSAHTHSEGILFDPYTGSRIVFHVWFQHPETILVGSGSGDEPVTLCKTPTSSLRDDRLRGVSGTPPTSGTRSPAVCPQTSDVSETSEVFRQTRTEWVRGRLSPPPPRCRDGVNSPYLPACGFPAPGDA
jgi:hypothetical protein